jgi:hypothetical protein
MAARNDAAIVESLNETQLDFVIELLSARVATLKTGERAALAGTGAEPLGLGHDEHTDALPGLMSIGQVAIAQQMAKKLKAKRLTVARGILDTFVVPGDYDFAKGTQENYANADLHDFHGEFRDIRATRDASYHGNYTKARQILQDQIIRNVIGAGVKHPSPWIVFTAGAMGAGKSHTINWMSDNDYFPLPDFIQVDPDSFRSKFPEWAL